MLAECQRVLDVAYAATPERFVNGPRVSPRFDGAGVRRRAAHRGRRLMGAASTYRATGQPASASLLV